MIDIAEVVLLKLALCFFSTSIMLIFFFYFFILLHCYGRLTKHSVLIYIFKIILWFGELYYQVLGFGEYIEEVYAAYEQHKIETMVTCHYSMLLMEVHLSQDWSFENCTAQIAVKIGISNWLKHCFFPTQLFSLFLSDMTNFFWCPPFPRACLVYIFLITGCFKLDNWTGELDRWWYVV